MNSGSTKSVIAMDGGGTNLRVSGISKGRLFRKSYKTGVNLTAVESEELIKTFLAVRDDFWIPDMLLAAFSGAGDRPREEKLTSALKAVFDGTSIEVIMDIEGLYRAAVGQGKGIVVISGTGSTVYGHDSEGNPVRAGGWGHVFDDEGSGYWISKEIITRALRHRDGLLPHDPIFDLLLEFYEVESIEKLVNLTIQKDFKTRIASFSRVALEETTPLSVEVIEEGIRILAGRTLRVLDIIGGTDIIYIHGGSFKSSYFLKRFEDLAKGYKTSLFDGNIDEILAYQIFERFNKE